MESKNFFEAWLETQNKMISNWTEASKKMQSAVAGGEVAEKGSEIYKEWLKSQTEIVNEAKEQATEKITDSVNSKNEDFSTWYKNWFETQKKNTEKWSDNAQSFYKPFADMTKGTNSFSNLKTMNEYGEAYNNWLKNWSKPFEGMLPTVSNDSSKDAFKGILDSTNTYFKMFEIWMPFYKGMMNNQYSPANFSNFFNAERFKELMGTTMPFISPEPLKDAMQQANEWMQNLNSYSKHVYSGYMNQVQESGKHFNAAMFGNNNPMAEAFENMQRSFKFLAPGKETELNETFVSVMDLVGRYAMKTNEVQYQILSSAQKNLEDIMTESAEEVQKNGMDFSNYGTFFQKWIQKTENSFIDLFKTDEYSKLQGELINLGTEIKGKVEKLTESTLAPYPVVLRSEADDLHKTIYELKKRVKELERAVVSSTESSDEAEKKTAKSAKRKETV